MKFWRYLIISFVTILQLVLSFGSAFFISYFLIKVFDLSCPWYILTLFIERVTSLFLENKDSLSDFFVRPLSKREIDEIIEELKEEDDDDEKKS